MGIQAIDGQLYYDMVRQGAARLDKNRNIVNELNVFPVPDGDTGDNMYMTIQAGEVEPEDTLLGDVSHQIARGMLLGARGNSGVILSRIFSGIAGGLKGVAAADVNMFASAMESSISEAYSSVSKPVEGTILTVYRDGVRKARANIREGSSFENFFEDLLAGLRESLEKTPELLQTLKDAGVVDSGGAGLVIIAEGMQDALLGNCSEESDSQKSADPSRKKIDFSLFTEDDEMTYGYCTEFLLRLQNRKTDISRFDISALTAYLNSAGDSVVSFQEDSIVKVHVHTMNPGEVLTHCQQFGEFLTLKIENMALQHNETVRKEEEKPLRGIDIRPHRHYGLVAVASGEGMVSTFKELGVDEVIEGGQSMNPPAEAFVKAFRSLNCDTVLVYPNNSNIYLTACQAAALCEDMNVRIIRTRSMGDGYACISMLDTEEDEDTVEANAAEVMESIRNGVVAAANRSVSMDGIDIKAGDFIGYENDTIHTAADTAPEAAEKLAAALGAENFDILLLIAGKDADLKETEALKKRLKETYSDVEIFSLDGGQPIYTYMMVLE